GVLGDGEAAVQDRAPGAAAAQMQAEVQGVLELVEVVVALVEHDRVPALGLRGDVAPEGPCGGQRPVHLFRRCRRVDVSAGHRGLSERTIPAPLVSTRYCSPSGTRACPLSTELSSQ